ncbi:MAG: leucyl aminopeptidase [Candidatus Dormibacteria bacterium]
MQAKAVDTEVGKLRADALLLTLFQDEPLGPSAQRIDRALDGLLTSMLASGELNGKFPERRLVPTLGRTAAPRVMLLGLGHRDLLDGYRLRNALQFAVRDLRNFCRSLAVIVEPALAEVLAVPATGQAPQAPARAIAEGVALGNYRLGELRAAEGKGAIEELQLVGLGQGSDLAAALTAGVRLAEATNAARVLQWRPANRLTPADFIAEAELVAKQRHLSLRVVERPEMEKLGMGALLAVAQGSHQPPKLMVMRYRPRSSDGSGRVLALLGKGITFDSGGISLKPNPGMAAMKSDMSGAAAVLQAMGVIARTEPHIEVLGLAPLTENMPGGRAVKPGDVVTAMNGTTIEINNTDAEGRLVLADALAYAVSQGATHLVDVATLTGAASVALGHPVTAAMASSQELLAAVQAAAREAGERVWELPLYPEHDVALTCEIADIRNTSGTPAAGTINGAVFLRQFAAGRPFVHLDIAASSYHFEPLLKKVVPQGPTGVMTRTLAHLPFHLG